MAKKKAVVETEHLPPVIPTEIDAEELEDKWVMVERPIQQDGLLDGGGWAQAEVPAALAYTQLSLPAKDRNPQWKNVRWPK